MAVQQQRNLEYLDEQDPCNCGPQCSGCPREYYDHERTRRELLDGIEVRHRNLVQTGAVTRNLAGVIPAQAMDRGTIVPSVMPAQTLGVVPPALTSNIASAVSDTGCGSGSSEVVGGQRARLWGVVDVAILGQSSSPWFQLLSETLGSDEEVLTLLGLRDYVRPVGVEEWALTVRVSDLAEAPTNFLSLLGFAGCPVTVVVDAREYCSMPAALTWLPQGTPCWAVAWGGTPSQGCSSLTLSVPTAYHVTRSESGSLEWGAPTAAGNTRWLLRVCRVGVTEAMWSFNAQGELLARVPPNERMDPCVGLIQVHSHPEQQLVHGHSLPDPAECELEL